MRFSEILLERLVPKLTCNQEEIDKKVAEGIAAGLKEQQLKAELEEYKKQFPKTTAKDITSGPNWQVGDWVAVEGVVYEITAAKEVTKEFYYNPYHRFTSVYSLPSLERKYWKGTSLNTTYGLKLKTIPLKGQEAVEGWVDDLQHHTHLIIKRTLVGLDLKNDNS